MGLIPRWLVLTLLLAGVAAAQEEFTQAELQWLDEVELLMSPLERDVFLGLPAAERPAFMKEFWVARDPVPSTAVNEMQVEHRKRIQYADQNLREGSARPGSKTDRGWAYIVLGPPRGVLRFSNRRDLFPTEVWQFESKGRPGLPAQFYLTFFRPLGVGEYRLYNPAVDRPTALLAGGTNRSLDDAEAVATLRGIDAELARSSLSLDVGGPHDFEGGTIEPGVAPQFAKMQRIAQQQAPDQYARRWSAASTQIDTAVSFQPFEVPATARTIRASDGSRFLEYVLRIAPENLVLEEAEGRYHLGLELYAAVLDVRGLELMDATGRTETSLSAEELAKIRNVPLCVVGTIPSSEPVHALRFVVRQPGRLTRAMGRGEALADAPPPPKPDCAWMLRLPQSPLEHPAYRMQRGRQLEAAGQPEAALQELKSALSAAPEDPQLLLALATAHLRQGHAAEVSALLDARVAKLLATVGPLENGSLEELAAAASAKVMAKDFDRAAEFYTRAVEAQPYSPQFLNALGAVQQARGRLKEAAALYRRSLEADPEQARIRELLRRVQG